MKCLYCHFENPSNVRWCNACGKEMIQSISKSAMKSDEPSEEYFKLAKSGFPITGCILISVSCLIGIFTWLILAAVSSIFIGTISITWVATIFIFLEVVALVSTSFAFNRSNYGTVIFGGILATVLGLFTIVLIGTILAFIGLVLIVISHREFK